MFEKTIYELVEEKQKQYYELQEELKTLIQQVYRSDVHYNGRKCRLLHIYEDGTADILIPNRNTGELQEVKLVQLSVLHHPL